MLTDGAAHAVDSSELAFKLASVYAFRAAYGGAGPNVLEPIMTVEVTVPAEFQVPPPAARHVVPPLYSGHMAGCMHPLCGRPACQPQSHIVWTAAVVPGRCTVTMFP